MQATIYKPTNKILSNYIEYFLFLKNNGEKGSYKTFANTNTCLAFYKESNVNWCRESNICEITENGSQIRNKLFGFHIKPFTVNYSGNIDQICIIFKTGGLRMFTKNPVNKIDLNDNPFEQIFGKDKDSFAKKLFSLCGEKNQADLLEMMLARNLNDNAHDKALYLNALNMINDSSFEEDVIVKYLSKKLSINPSTIYRNFLSTFGQSPIELYKTIRFRKALENILSQQQNFTHTAYSSNFFDQSHLIKNIKQFTGETPGNLLKTISQVGGSLIWSK